MSRNLDNAIYDILTLEENPRTNFAGNSLEFRGNSLVGFMCQHGMLSNVTVISDGLRSCFNKRPILSSCDKFSHYLLLLEGVLDEENVLNIKLSQNVLTLTLSDEQKKHKRTFKFPQKPTYNEFMSFLTCHTLDMISTCLKLPTNSN